MKKLILLLLALTALPASPQSNYTRMLSGVNYLTGSSYAFVAADTTRVTVFNSSSSVAATLSTGSSSALFGAGSIFSVVNIGANPVTITCSGCTINASATLILLTNAGADIYGDGVNYVAVLGGGGGGSGTGTLQDPGSNSLVYRYSPTLTQPAVAANIVNLFSGCSGVELLGADGNCHSTGTGNLSTTPSAAQIISQPSAGGSTPGTDFGSNTIEQVRYATEFSACINQAPGGTISPGSTTITINACRGINAYSASPGVNSFYLQHYLRLSGGTGTAENVLLTATNCTGASTGTCTVTFTAANPHSGAWTISSATAGWQEAYVDGLTVSLSINPRNGVVVKGSPAPVNGNYTFYAPFNISEPRGNPGPVIMDCQGSAILSLVSGAAAVSIYSVTTPYLAPQGAAVENCLITPAPGLGRTADGTTRAIYDAGEGTLIFNNSFPLVNSSDFFDYPIYIDDDQKVSIFHNFANTGNGPAMKCDSTFCGAFIYGSGTNGGALGSIVDNDISVLCHGNGITWLSGNGVTIRDNVIQAWNQWGIQYGPGLQDMTDGGGNYFEGSAGCVNPDFGVSGYGQQNRISYWGANILKLGLDHGMAFGTSKVFSSTGSTIYDYYIQGVNGSSQQSLPFFVGSAATDGSTQFTFLYKPFGATTYNVLRSGPLATDGTSTAPYGTGNWAVATGVSCSSSPCSYTETFASPTSITIAPAYVPSFSQMPYWPVPILMGNNPTSLAARVYEGVPQAVVPTGLITAGTPYQARFPDSYQAVSSSGNEYTGALIYYDTPTQASGQTGTSVSGAKISTPNGFKGNTLTGETGYYNAGVNATTADSFNLIFQIYDADSAKTIATGGHQRAMETGDCGIGQGTTAAHFGFFCGTDFTFWNNVSPSSSNWTMQITAALLSLKVPLSSNSLGTFPSVALSSGSLSTTAIANAASTGTTVNKLTKLTGAPSTAVIAATTDTNGVVGITVSGAGTTGNASIATNGIASCVFDGATTAGDFVQISSTTGGDCHDAGSSYPSSNQVLGLVLSSNGSGGAYSVILGTDIEGGSSGGGTTLASLTDVALSAPSGGQCLVYNSGTSKWNNNSCASAGAAFQVNATNLSSISTINFLNSAAFNGLTVTVANPSAGGVQFGLSGTFGVGGGGTGLTAGASGGIPCFNSSSTMASSAALAVNQFLFGGGAGSCPTAAALTGDVTSTGPATTISANAVNSSKLAVVNTYRVCGMVFGSDNSAGSTLASADIAPQTSQCFLPAAATVVEVDVYADNGVPSVAVAKNHSGTVTNLTSSALSTAASGGRACANSGGTAGLGSGPTCSASLSVTSLAAGDVLLTNTATADGVARSMKVFITYTVN